MRTHVYPLDAVRFFAAASVVAFHLAFYAWASQSHATVAVMLNHAVAYPTLAPFSWFGWVGVEIFFVISGFVIANSANNASPIAFAKSRVLRLYPAVWVCALIPLAAWLLIDHAPVRHTLGEFGRSLALWPFGPWIDGVYWSLAVEMVFYALIFLVLALHGFSRLSWAAWGLLLASGAFGVARFAADNALSESGVWLALRANADILLLRYGVFFALGIWMWLSSVRAMSRWDWIGAAVAAACCCMEINQRTLELNAGEAPVDFKFLSIIPIAIWLGMAALMFWVSRAPERFAPRTARTQGALKRVGQMTYPLYLTHAVAGAGLIRLLVNAGVNRWAALGLAITAALVVAYLVARFAEPAVRVALRSVWERAEAQLKRVRGLAFLFSSGGGVSTPAA